MIRSFHWSRAILPALLLVLLAGVALAQEAAPPPSPAVRMLTAGQAVVLGIVEGVTEYLPVSSTGHLLLTQKLMKLEGTDEDSKTAIDAYEVIIQAGAILAVLLLYFGRVKLIVLGLFGKSKEGARLLVNVILAFLPAAIIGFALEHKIQHYLFGLWPVSTAWLVGGIVILGVANARKNTPANLGKTMESLSPKQALIIGLMQCLAMWPGVSRSLATILGGLLVGMSAMAAVEFSFLLGLVTLSAATLLEVVKHHHAITHTLGVVNPLIGFVFAGIFAFLSVKWMVDYLNRRGLGIFGYYRLAAGIVVIGLLATGWLAK